MLYPNKVILAIMTVMITFTVVNNTWAISKCSTLFIDVLEKTKLSDALLDELRLTNENEANSIFLGVLKDYRSIDEDMFGFLNTKTLEVYAVSFDSVKPDVRKALSLGRKILSQPIQEGESCAAHALVNALTDLEINKFVNFTNSPIRNHSLLVENFIQKLYAEERKSFSFQKKGIVDVLNSFHIEYREIRSNTLAGDKPLIEHLKKGGTAIISFPAHWKDYHLSINYLKKESHQDYMLSGDVNIVTPGGNGDGVSAKEGHFAYIRGILEENSVDPILIIQDSHFEFPTFWHLSELNPSLAEKNYSTKQAIDEPLLPTAVGKLLNIYFLIEH